MSRPRFLILCAALLIPIALLSLLYALLISSVVPSTSSLGATSPSNPVAKSTNKILFTSIALGSGWELFTVNSDGTDLKQLTSLRNLIGAHQWSPDGQYIAFTTFSGGFSLDLILNVMNADGSDLRQLSQSMTGKLRWSPDNRQVAFTTKRDGLGEIYLVSRDGGSEKRLTHGSTQVYMNDVYDMSWSPDGKQIAFIRPYQLFVINIDGTNERALTLNTNSATAAAWSPDGKLIAFVMTEKQKPGIYTMRPDGSNVRKVIDIPSDYTGLDWSPDGQRLTYTQKNDGKVSLFVVDVDGKNNRQLASNIVGASWSPDGKQMVYSESDANLRSTLYIVDANGQNKRVLQGNNTFDHSPLWSPAR